MATDAVIYPTSTVASSSGVAWPAARRVQSFPGMAATTAIDGPKGGQDRLQARAPEMELIREAQNG